MTCCGAERAVFETMASAGKFSLLSSIVQLLQEKPRLRMKGAGIDPPPQAWQIVRRIVLAPFMSQRRVLYHIPWFYMLAISLFMNARFCALLMPSMSASIDCATGAGAVACGSSTVPDICARTRSASCAFVGR